MFSDHTLSPGATALALQEVQHGQVQEVSLVFILPKKYIPHSYPVPHPNRHFFISFLLIMVSSNAWSANYVVTNTADSVAGSLRQAIINANTNPGPDNITFAIPGCGVACTISLLTPLPLSGANGSNTTIDGYTQTGSAPATPATPAAPKIEINGSSIANNNFINITTAGNIV